MTPKLYKAADVCDLAQLQPYVLRSWEKEFPGIGIQKSADSPRMYRQSDVDQVLRIKQLVFGEGLTLAGARRKLDESMPSPPRSAEDVSDVIEVLGADVHNRIAHVRDGLRSLLHLLEGRASDARHEPVHGDAPARRPGSSAGEERTSGAGEYRLTPPAAQAETPARAKPQPVPVRKTASPPRSKASARTSATKRTKAPARAASSVRGKTTKRVNRAR